MSVKSAKRVLRALRALRVLRVLRALRVLRVIRFEAPLTHSVDLAVLTRVMAEFCGDEMFNSRILLIFTHSLFLSVSLFLPLYRCSSLSLSLSLSLSKLVFSCFLSFCISFFIIFIIIYFISISIALSLCLYRVLSLLGLLLSPPSLFFFRFSLCRFLPLCILPSPSLSLSHPFACVVVRFAVVAAVRPCRK